MAIPSAIHPPQSGSGPATEGQARLDVSLRLRTSTTWKSSTDPYFIIKMTRILALYDWAPPDGRVIETGPFGSH